MAEYGEWNRKGAVLSDVTAQKEYGVTRDFIVKGVQAGELEFRDGAWRIRSAIRRNAACRSRRPRADAPGHEYWLTPTSGASRRSRDREDRGIAALFWSKMIGMRLGRVFRRERRAVSNQRSARPLDPAELKVGYRR